MALKDTFIVRLAADQRGQLEQTARSGQHSARTLLHAHIRRKTDADGPDWDDARIAQALECGDRTVARVHKQFATGGLDAALHRKKPSGKQYRKLDGGQEAPLVARACNPALDGRGRWTLKRLADRLVELGVGDAVSDETVRRMLKKTRTAKWTGSVFLPGLGDRPLDFAGNASAAPAAADTPPTDDHLPHTGYGPPGPTPLRRSRDAASPPQPTDTPGPATPDPARLLYAPATPLVIARAAQEAFQVLVGPRQVGYLVARKQARPLTTADAHQRSGGPRPSAQQDAMPPHRPQQAAQRPPSRRSVVGAVFA